VSGIGGAVHVDHVSKVYRRRGQRAWLLQEALRFATRRQRPRSVLEALHDISFELAPGESLGVVGHNGAGKTTLLKIIAGITQPTSGSVTTSGKVSTQLGLGLGFNMQLTGRENVYLEGTLLGLSNREVRRRLGVIVEFADLDQAIEEPLWTYSSGMVSRLAFAAAAHTDFDTLLLDEALSAGDARFRARCDETLQHFRREGRTLIVVSHGVASITALCDRALWIDHGRMREIGDAASVTTSYSQR
jgi:lipopolysaccharide transport system ATP-binding protein